MRIKTLQAIGLTAAISFLACPTWAADEESPKPLTEAQAKERSEIIAKYDADKDGVLSQQEMKQLSPSDKRALARTGGVGTAKKAARKEAETKVKAVEKSTDHKSEPLDRKSEAKGAKASKAKGKH